MPIHFPGCHHTKRSLSTKSTIDTHYNFRGISIFGVQQQLDQIHQVPKQSNKLIMFEGIIILRWYSTHGQRLPLVFLA